MRSVAWEVCIRYRWNISVSDKPSATALASRSLVSAPLILERRSGFMSRLDSASHWRVVKYAARFLVWGIMRLGGRPTVHGYELRLVGVTFDG
jgi:hypothetical protein